MRWPDRTTVERDRDPAASMALLEEVLDPSLGPGYWSAAESREHAGLPRSSGTATVLMFVVALGLGFLVTVAAVTLRAPDPAAAEARAELVERIQAAQEAGDEHSRQVEALRAEILALEQERALSESGPQAEREIAASALRAGAQAVRGPGVVITLEDAEQAPDQAPGEEARPERVNARDLQIVVNGLWSAGAEAVSVNEHRLTSTSAIRFAGEAVIVDFRGLTPPYVVKAVGDPQRLAAETSTGLTGAYLAELRSQLQLRTSVTQEESVTIRAAERLTTRVARVSEDTTTEEQP